MVGRQLAGKVNFQPGELTATALVGIRVTGGGHAYPQHRQITAAGGAVRIATGKENEKYAGEKPAERLQLELCHNAKDRKSQAFADKDSFASN